MAFLLKREEGESKSLVYPTGTVHAVVVGVYNLGTHPNFFNKDKAIDDRRQKIALKYELAGHTYKDKTGTEFPMTILDGSEFNLWFNPKSGKTSAFYKKVKAILGASHEGSLDEGIDPSTLLGKNVWVTIEEYKEGKFKITNHTEIPETVAAIAGTIAPEFFALEPDASGDIAVPGSIPQWVQDEITSSDEYVEWVNSAATNAVSAAPLPTPVLASAPAPAPVAPAAPVLVAPAPAAPVAPAVPVPAAPMPVDLSQVPEAYRKTVEAGLAKLNANAG